MQRPYPPLWYGLARPEGLPWVVANRVNVVCNGPPALVRQVTDGYRRDWAAAGHAPTALPLMGMTRTIVVADSEAEALAIARRAHQRWYPILCCCGTSTAPSRSTPFSRQFR